MSKVAFLIGSLAYGGAEKTVSELLNNIPDEIEKFLILSDAKLDYTYRGKLLLLNIKSAHGMIGASINFIKKWHRLNTIKKEYAFTHTISFMEGSNIINILTKQNDKIILSIRNYISNKKKDSLSKYIVRLLIRFFYNKADVIVVVSKFLKVELENNYKIISNKIRVIYNFFDISKIQNLYMDSCDDYDNIFHYSVIVNVGRLTQSKGQWHLLRMFKKINETIPGTKLFFLGDGELRDFLLDYSRNCGLVTYSTWESQEINNNYDVYFLGFQDNPYKFISKSKLFVFPSLSEGFPNALVEAMACGIPVVSSDCKSGPREILSPTTDIFHQTEDAEFAEYGILMPVPDGIIGSADAPLTEVEKKWVEIIIKILIDKKLYRKYSALSSQRADDFSIDNIIHQWNELIISK